MLTKNIEAVLFAVGAPVSMDRLKELTGAEETEISDAICEIEKRHSAEESGISLIRLEDSFQLCTKADTGDLVKRALELKKAPPLTKAALEVLAIIAYNQPVTRSFIEQVRGIDSSYIVANLFEKGLVSEQGQLDAPGRPTLFGTTDAFLRCFGLASLAELPKVELPNPEQLTLSSESDDGSSGTEAEAKEEAKPEAEAELEPKTEQEPFPSASAVIAE